MNGVAFVVFGVGRTRGNFAPYCRLGVLGEVHLATSVLPKLVFFCYFFAGRVCIMRGLFFKEKVGSAHNEEEGEPCE